MNPEDLTYLAPTAGSAMVPLDFASPPASVPDIDQPMEKDGQEEFVPFFPFMPLSAGTDGQQAQDGGGLLSQVGPPSPG